MAVLSRFTPDRLNRSCEADLQLVGLTHFSIDRTVPLFCMFDFIETFFFHASSCTWKSLYGFWAPQRFSCCLGKLCGPSVKPKSCHEPFPFEILQSHRRAYDCAEPWFCDRRPLVDLRLCLERHPIRPIFLYAFHFRRVCRMLLIFPIIRAPSVIGFKCL